MPPAPRRADLRCSARSCRSQASSALLWNNPKLHTTERLKVWLACEEHVVPLSEFLSIRGFLRDTVTVEELTDAHG